MTSISKQFMEKSPCLILILCLLTACDDSASPLEALDALASLSDVHRSGDASRAVLQPDMNWDMMQVRDVQTDSDAAFGDEGPSDLGQLQEDSQASDGNFNDVLSNDMMMDVGAETLNSERTARRWAEAYCAYIRPCATGVLKVAAWADGDCIDQVYLSIRDGELAQIEYGLVAGLIELEPEAITGCINSYATLDCASEDQLGNSRRLDAACKEIVRGRLEDGQRCADDMHCSSTLCLGADACNGVCAPRSGLDEPCSADCIGQCQCEIGLVCDMGFCRQPRAVGDMCSRDSMCEGAPVFTTCTRDGERDGECSLRPLPVIPAVGGRCGPALLGEPSCHIEHHCVYRAGTGTDQGRCDIQFEGPGCPLAFPDMCPEDTFCADVVPRRGARSAVFMGRCQPRADDGEACWAIGTRAITPESNCQRGLLCLNDRGLPVGRFGPADEVGRCYARRPLGTQCSADSQCASRRCIDDVCVVQLDCSQPN